MPKFRHYFITSFSIESDVEDPFEVPVELLRAALLRSLAERDEHGEWGGAFQPDETDPLDD